MVNERNPKFPKHTIRTTWAYFGSEGTWKKLEDRVDITMWLLYFSLKVTVILSFTSSWLEHQKPLNHIMVGLNSWLIHVDTFGSYCLVES